MEVSALKYSGGVGLHGRSPLLRLQSDERLISLLRRGNTSAFEVLVARYESRMMAFCRHLLGSREDAEDVLQEVMTAAFNAILADDRPINVRPWLYRIARNRSLNHLRRAQAIGVDSMDHHLSEHGATTADKVHEREEFRLLVGDIHELPETQKTALVLREMDALSYEQIAEAMETTVPSVKSLLVRARVSLAEASEARLLSCDEVRIELAEIAEGLQRRPSPLVRRHLRSCKRCTTFRSQLKQTNRALAALLPVGPLAMFHKVLFFHLGHSAASGSTASVTAAGAAGAGAAGTGAAGAGAAGAVGTAVAGGAAAGSSGLISAGIGAIAGKAAAGLAAAALVTAGAVEAGHSSHRHLHRATVTEAAAPAATPATHPAPASPSPSAQSYAEPRSTVRSTAAAKKVAKHVKVLTLTKTVTTDTTAAPPTTTTTAPATAPAAAPAAGRTQTQSDPTVLPTIPDAGATTTPASQAPSPATGTTPTGMGTTPTTTTPGDTDTTTTTTTTPPTATGTTGTTATPTTATGTTPTTTTPGETATPSTPTGPAPSSEGTPSPQTSPVSHSLAFWRIHPRRAWGSQAASLVVR
ncbi:MAG TPA: RNA polymerase sigma factor [Solirubrobacteraceae bacterium]|jgi:RNA polymerase sigma factor (sigma-70 family)